jgi:hypothetical protein
MAAFVSLLVTGLVESDFHVVLMRLRLVWDLEFRMRMLDCKHLWGLLSVIHFDVIQELCGFWCCFAL